MFKKVNSPKTQVIRGKRYKFPGIQLPCCCCHGTSHQTGSVVLSSGAIYQPNSQRQSSSSQLRTTATFSFVMNRDRGVQWNKMNGTKMHGKWNKFARLATFDVVNHAMVHFSVEWTKYFNVM